MGTDSTDLKKNVAALAFVRQLLKYFHCTPLTNHVLQHFLKYLHFSVH